MSQVSLLGIMLGMMLMGCSAPTPAEPITATSPTPIASETNQGQSLPISAQMEVRGVAIALEVAQTEEQQAIGLMNRTSLADDRGMLFPFDPPRSVGFWMKNTLIPLDMVFLRAGKVVAIANATPCTADPCPTYTSGTTVDEVVELRSGRAAEVGLTVGDRVEIRFLQN